MKKITLALSFPAIFFLLTSLVFAPADLTPGIYPDIPERPDFADYPYRPENSSQSPQYAPNQIIIKFNQPVADSVENQLKVKTPSGRLQMSQNLDQLNAKHKIKAIKPLFKNFKQHRQQLKALQENNNVPLTKKQKHILRRLKRAPKNAKIPALDRIYKLELDLDEGQSLEDVLIAYNASPDVEYAELNYIVSICKTPNDPLYPIQWPLNNTGQMYPESGSYNPPPGTPDADIDAPEAWDVFTGSQEIIVAVINTGVDYNHRDLANNMWTNSSGHYGYDFINDDTDPIDDHGHGTHCAGIIAAEGNNGLDITGVCWNVKIMTLKCFNASGSGLISDALEAFYYAVENGADVTSNSWGGGGSSLAMQDAIDYAHSQGVIMVCGAGNDYSDNPGYPSLLEHMFSVAATNSNDEKPSFSNYGDEVDIAAPGVDILSLRAGGTSMGTPYDDYTTVASGTSMACPHVSGACALLLSMDPLLGVDEIEQYLLDSADPIAPEICTSGRLNIYEATKFVSTPQGRILLDEDIYSCSDSIGIRLLDSDLSGSGTYQVDVSTDANDLETVTLTEGASAIGIFTGTILTNLNTPNPGDNILQISHGKIITVTYNDADDGTGNPATVTDAAEVDCQPPVISNVQIDPQGPEPKVTFDTNEPTTARILCGTGCGGPYSIDVNDLDLSTSHSIRLPGVSPTTDYFFIIEAADVVDNQTTDDNTGDCYTFTTDSGPGDIFVPADFPTIQAAIDVSWDGGTVWVADGTYTGQGNRDIDFLGKAITVRGQNGPQNCIIDCNGTEIEPHRGFYFHSDEDSNSILDGFTITNGYARTGGGIFCEFASPKLTNCIITGNSARYGGGVNCGYTGTILTNCVITSNYAVRRGGGVGYCRGIIRNCTISSNTSGLEGGGLYFCYGKITNCTITGNYAGETGGGLHNCSAPISNCLITGNKADAGGGIFYSHGTISNCTIADNTAVWRGGAIERCYSGPIVNCIIYNNQPPPYYVDPPLYSCVQNDANGKGSFDADPCFVAPGYWDDNSTPADANDDFWVDGDYHLKPGSPCIGAGNFTYSMTLPSTDFDGNTRLAGPQIDMGCFEANSPPDSDGDWLADSCEPGYENNYDRDSDGIPDGLESLQGTDANLPDPLRQWNIPSDTNSIQQALFFSRDGETITLSEGIYYENIFIGGRNITLTGTNPDDPNVVAATIINADTDSDPCTPNGRGVTFYGTENSNCSIQGLSITAGYTNVYGGGISGGYYPYHSQAQIKNCIITANKAGLAGGGVQGCDGPIINCTISQNSANNGGGLSLCNGPIADCTITNNYARSGGGGLRSCDGPITNCVIRNNSTNYGGGLCGCQGPITDCIISENTALYYGGGFYVCGEIINCTISNNSAGRDGGGLAACTGPITNSTINDNSAGKYGGGILIHEWYSLTVKNCLLTGNSADYGGAMHLFNQRAEFTNCTFVENFAIDGSVICCQSFGLGWKSNLAIINSILWNGSGSILNKDASIIDITYSNVQGGYAGTGNINTNPYFVDSVNDDYHLMEDSPCINTGDPCYVPEPNEKDLDNRPRIIDGRIDMGPFEFNDNNIPSADAGPNQTAYANEDCMALVTLDGSTSYDKDDDPLTYLWTWQIDSLVHEANGLNPTIELPSGEHTIELIVNDGIEDSVPDEVVITVIDNTPPELTLTVTPETLWPPDNKMVEITVDWTATDNCDDSPQVSLVDIIVEQDDELIGSLIDSDDIELDGDTIYLRAARSGRASSRIYSLIYQATDASGNATEQTATVTVPHDRRKAK